MGLFLYNPPVFCSDKSFRLNLEGGLQTGHCESDKCESEETFVCQKRFYIFAQIETELSLRTLLYVMINDDVGHCDFDLFIFA